MDRQQHLDLGAIARAIIDSNFYMTLGTADETGRPWVSPVYYAPESYAKFYWVSSPEATRSRNLAARPEVSIVIFDSRTPIGSGQGVYMSAVAEELTDTDLDRCIAIFSHRSEAHGAGEWTSEDVRLAARARIRLYWAAALEHSVLGPQGRRIPVSCRAMTGERLPRLPQARELIPGEHGHRSCVLCNVLPSMCERPPITNLRTLPVRYEFSEGLLIS